MAWIAGSLPRAGCRPWLLRVPIGGGVSIRSVVPDVAETSRPDRAPLAEVGEGAIRARAAACGDPLQGLRVSYSSLELLSACSLRYHLQVELRLTRD